MLKIRQNATVAHIAPLAVFLVLSSLVPWIEIKNSALPWWRSAPQHWLYPLQTLVCGGLLVFFRRHYILQPCRGFTLAVLFSGIGIAAWIFPAWLHHRQGGEAGIPLLGYVTRTEGFDPTIFENDPFLYPIVIGMRFARMVLVVPFIEEIFWRSFLMRWIVGGDDRPFWKVPFGTHRWKAFGITTAAFVLIHAREDWLGALIFGSLMYFLCVRTKSLAACVLMHAVANLLLGIYVLKTRQWGFW